MDEALLPRIISVDDHVVEPAHVWQTWLPAKFRDDGLLLVHAGGGAGLFSAIIGGWINGPGGSQPVTREVRP